MAAVMMIARAEARGRWRALVGLGLLGALVGAVVLGALVGARRTDTAFERLMERTGYWDAEVEIHDASVAEAIAALPQVETSWLLDVNVGQLLGIDEVMYLGFSSGPERPSEHYRPVVVEGRMFEPAADDEIVVSELAARAFGWDVGDQLDFGGLSPEQMAAFEQGEVPAEPAGARTALTITGVIRDPNDALPFELARVIATPAYHERVAPAVGGIGLLTVRLNRGGADLEAFTDAVTATAGAEQARVSPVSVHAQRGGVDQATSVAVRALLAFAAIAALAGSVALGQALHRSTLQRSSDLDAHRAIGLDRRARLLACVLPLLPVVVVAAAGSVVGAAAGSVLTPVGVGRSIEPSRGFELNVALLALGGVAVGLCVLALCVGVGIGQLRSHAHRAISDERASRFVRRAVAAGAPIPLVMGTRFAVDRGRGRTAVPTRSALLGAVVGITGAVAAIAVLASLDRTSGSPERYGWSHDISVVGLDEGRRADLEANPAVASITMAQHGSIELDGLSADAIALDGPGGRTVLSGRMPAGVREVALGPALADELGVIEGDTVAAVGADGRDHPLRVVGFVLTEGPALYAERAVLDAPAVDVVRLSGDLYVDGYVDLTPHADTDQVAADLATIWEIAVAEEPAEVLNLEQARGVILLLSAFMSLLALAAVGHALVLTVRRRRHELAVLRALGFTGRQLGGSIRSMAVVLLGVALLVGIPLGLVVGSVAWGAMAEAVHVPADMALPVVRIAVLVAAAAMAGAALAELPARHAEKVAPSTALRTE